jgi:hypothetical protein
MNPDKLFDYLEGRLPAAERAALERRLIWMSNINELAGAADSHRNARGDSRMFLATTTGFRARRKMALRVGSAFIILMAVNVAYLVPVNRQTRNQNGIGAV